MLFDTTVFCGALLNPDGGNMQCLLLAQGPFFIPVISQGVLHEFVHVAVHRGLGHGARRRVYTPTELCAFLEALAPLLTHAVPVGLRDILPSMVRLPWLAFRSVLAQVATAWPADLPQDALTAPVHTWDAHDAHVILAAIEQAVDIVVTSNVTHFDRLKPWCAVETPSTFLRRWIP